MGEAISPLEQVAAELGRNFSWTGPDMIGALFLEADRSENNVKGCLPERDTPSPGQFRLKTVFGWKS